MHDFNHALRLARMIAILAVFACVGEHAASAESRFDSSRSAAHILVEERNGQLVSAQVADGETAALSSGQYKTDRVDPRRMILCIVYDDRTQHRGPAALVAELEKSDTAKVAPCLHNDAGSDLVLDVLQTSALPPVRQIASPGIPGNSPVFVRDDIVKRNQGSNPSEYAKENHPVDDIKLNGEIRLGDLLGNAGKNECRIDRLHIAGYIVAVLAGISTITGLCLIFLGKDSGVRILGILGAACSFVVLVSMVGVEVRYHPACHSEAQDSNGINNQ